MLFLRLDRQPVLANRTLLAERSPTSFGHSNSVQVSSGSHAFAAKGAARLVLAAAHAERRYEFDRGDILKNKKQKTKIHTHICRLSLSS